MNKHIANSSLFDITGFKMYIHKGDKGIGKSLHTKAETREAGLTAMLVRNLKPGMFAVDIGANIGFVTLQMCKIVGPEGKVSAFEPDPCNYDLLVNNLAINGYADMTSTYHVAVSDKKGVLNFHRSEQSNLGSVLKNKKATKGTVKVNALSIDEWSSVLPKMPNFYKMDIEGYEVEVLRGMYETLKRSAVPSYVLIEVHPQFYSKERSFGDELKRVSQIGYTIKHVESAAVPVPDIFSERGFKPDPSFLLPKGYRRCIFSDIPNDDAIYLCSTSIKQWSPREKNYSPKVVRTILLSRE